MVEALKARVARGIHLIVHHLQTFEFGLDGCALGVDGRTHVYGPSPDIRS